MDKTVIDRRLAGLRAILQQKQLDGALFTSYENRRYYSGFTGSAGYLMVSMDKEVLVTDKRYTEQAMQQTTGCTVLEHGAGRQQRVAQEIAKLGITRLAMEDTMEAGEYVAIISGLEGITTSLEGECFLEQRMIKDAGEIQLIREVIQKADNAFAKLVPMLKAGMTEKDLADELHYLSNKEGAEALSFGTIVAAGPRGALAHGAPTTAPINPGDMVVVDYGIQWEGYLSDMTRTLLFGNVPKEQLDMFQLVLEAMQAAFAAIRPGVLAKEVEQAHRDVFLKAGVEDYALKGLGHGVGLQIHECPRIVIGNETVLQPGMVFTVEPGLYFPGRFGVRTEDVVLVTETGYENLTHTPYTIQITN